MNAINSLAWIITLIFSCMLISQGAKPKNRVEFTKVECKSLHPEIVRINCSLENFSAISSDFEIYEDVTELRGNYSVYVKHGNHTFPYVSQEIDYCTILGNVHKQPLIQMMVSEIRRVSNLPLCCPIKKNSRFYTRGYKVDPKVIPKYMPKMSFSSEATFISNRKEVLRISTFGRLKN